MKKYSATEQHLLVLLDGGDRITTSALAKEHYRKVPPSEVPKFPRQSISWILRSLVKKVKANNEAFVIRSTEHAGPHEMQHWLER